MRLYIPTSSLNADNILSCECIAPAKIYPNREFGYQKFEVLEELKEFSNFILGFSHIPQFSIEDKERENYPMVIAIEVSNSKCFVPVGKFNGVEIFASATPFFVTPQNLQFLFFKEEERNRTKLDCSVSEKSKLFNFFEERFSLLSDSDEKTKESLSACLEKVISSLPESHLDKHFENNFDKVKGFVWGYGMGNLLSSTPLQFEEDLELKKDPLGVQLKNADEHSDLFNQLMEELVWNDGLSLERIRTERFGEATKIAQNLKKTRGLLWENSAEQKYIQQLRENIAKFTPFELDSLPQPGFAKSCCFCFKGRRF